jgi:hypothetical protein
MDKGIAQKVAYLESLGVVVNDYDTHEGMHSGVFFSSVDGDYEILFDEFEVGEALHIICQRATEYSVCCGDVIDKDFRICPSCQEHV